MSASKSEPLHILITTDGSEASFAAIGPVCDLARRTAAKLTLLRVVLEPGAKSQVGFKTPPGVLGKLADAEVIAGKQELAGLQPRFGSVPVDLQVVTAPSAVDGILSFAKSHRVDLLAIASHGRSGLSRLLMGSTAEEVLRRSPLPVLIVPCGPAAG